MDNYGFIVTRHVNSKKTNNYWNHCVKCIQKIYPLKKIVIIDDNSNQQYIKEEAEYKNVEIIQSEYPGRGELLPYYYFYKYRFFENAVIIHDSVFFHKRIPFEIFKDTKVLPLWHFNEDRENYNRTLTLLNSLNKNRYQIQQKINVNTKIMGMNFDKWYGCFGLQSYINLVFLTSIANKYHLFHLLKVVNCRADRCCLERIFGVIFTTEYPMLLNCKSLFGDIFHYQKWGYSYDQYKQDIEHKRLPKYIVKIWTGR